jgi:hypothetical protein
MSFKYSLVALSLLVLAGCQTTVPLKTEYTGAAL